MNGQRILIHGGSGGVRHFAIQFAKAKGAYVITTVSQKSREFVTQLGADKTTDYKQQRFENEVRDVDMVFDLIGGQTQERSWDVLRQGGILVSTLTEPSYEMASKRGIRATRYTAEESGAELTEIAALIDAGQVKPHIAKILPLDQVAAAQRYLEEEHPNGKVVLTMP